MISSRFSYPIVVRTLFVSPGLLQCIPCATDSNYNHTITSNYSRFQLQALPKLTPHCLLLCPFAHAFLYLQKLFPSLSGLLKITHFWKPFLMPLAPRLDWLYLPFLCSLIFLEHYCDNNFIFTSLFSATRLWVTWGQGELSHLSPPNTLSDAQKMFAQWINDWRNEPYLHVHP